MPAVKLVSEIGPLVGPRQAPGVACSPQFRQLGFEDLGHAVVVEVGRLLSGGMDGCRVAAGHRITVAGPAQHLHVVGHIAEGHHVLGLDAQRGSIFSEGNGFVDSGQGHFQQGVTRR